MKIKDLFFPNAPSPEERAAQELNSAKTELLEAQSRSEYWQRMVQYNQDRVRRLEGYFVKSAESAK